MSFRIAALPSDEKFATAHLGQRKFHLRNEFRDVHRSVFSCRHANMIPMFICDNGSAAIDVRYIFFHTTVAEN